MRRTTLGKITATLMASAIFFLGSMAFNVSDRQVRADGYNAGIEAFVNSLYSDCLGRNADPTGFNDWCNKLATGQISGKQAAYGFFFSPEFGAKAGRISADDLINTYYKVFLNRDADPAGKTYWSGKIASMSTADDIIILFNGFADSVEFANKCASYGITVGTVSSPEVGSSASGQAAQTANANNLAAQTNGRRANSVEELDAYWTSRGYEVFYIDLGNGQTQKCYAKFYDMTNHNNMVNEWRAQNGLYAYNIITDPNDPRVAYTRMRAVEVAYSFSHGSPYSFNMGLYTDPRVNNGALGYVFAGENIANGTSAVTSIDIFRTSPMHNAAMLDAEYNHSMSTACCEVNFVQPDGLSIYVTAENWFATPTELPGYTGGLPAGTTMGTVQEFWE
ncbi:MAG: DUF4214 domain-containing protein [Saccharofermentans sp.]|nr:DUF4214 domain-containing protein [Saccharofermentans sp.]